MAIATQRYYIFFDVKRSVKVILPGHRYNVMRFSIIQGRVTPSEGWVFAIDFTSVTCFVQCIFETPLLLGYETLFLLLLHVSLV